MIRYYFKQILIVIVILSFLISGLNFYFAFKYPIKYENIILNEASANNLHMDFVSAVIAVESRFDKDAISRSGARGLMQLMPATAAQVAEDIGLENYNVDSLFDPNINITLGCRYLRYLKEKFFLVTTMLAAYNAGEGKVSEWLKDERYSPDGILIITTPYPETNAYIDRVLNVFKIYKNKRR